MMTAENQTITKYPTRTVYCLKDKEGSEKPNWINVGAAWVHDGKDGLPLSLTVLGQQLSLQVRNRKLKDT